MSRKVPHQSTVSGMAIRLPKKVVETLQQLKKEESLPSMATALQAWIQQQVQERTETRLTDVEEAVKKLAKMLEQAWQKQWQEQGEINTVVCAGIQKILGSDDPLSKVMREKVTCKDTQREKCHYAGEKGLIKKGSLP